MKRLAPFALFSALLLPSLAQAVSVVHSNDVMGEIEPCGCRNNPTGGMARKANFLKRLKDQEIIQVDAGDLLFATHEIPEMLRPQSKLQAEHLLKTMDELKHDAVVPGEKDFALGFKTFDELRKKAKLKFLAANLQRKNGKRYFDSHLILKKKDENGKPVTVAIIGLVGESLSWPKELKATSAIDAAKAEVKAVRGKADYVIALTHQGYEKDEALAKAVPGIDLIIGAHTQTFLQAPALIGTTRIYQSSFRNQYIGVIPLKKSAETKPEDYQLIALDTGYDSPADSPSSLDELVKKFKLAISELNSREEARALSTTQSGSPAGPKYQTFPRCAECHLKQFEFWRKTQHVKALDTLVQAKQAQNKECLSCHTVGLGDSEGFQFVNRIAELRKDGDKTTPMATDDLNAYLKAMHEATSLDATVRLTPQAAPQTLRQSLNGLVRSYTPVQCENCHQPGRDHPFSSGYTKTVSSETCLKCHTAERAPGWYKGKEPDTKIIEAKRALVSCPAGELESEN